MTRVSGVLCDGLGAGVPIVAVPMVNNRLCAHPVWAGTPATLLRWGVVLLDPVTGRPGALQPVPSGRGDAVTAGFDPGWVVASTGPAPSCG